MSSISGTVATPVTVGSAGYPSPLTITTSGVVLPTACGATGVISSTAGTFLYNQGVIDGSGAAATLAASAHDLRNFAGDEHRAMLDNQSMFSTHGVGSGSMQHTDPTLLALSGHGFSASALTDHGLAHASVMLR
jgi:hypothetical protein